MPVLQARLRKSRPHATTGITSLLMVSSSCAHLGQRQRLSHRIVDIIETVSLTFTGGGYGQNIGAGFTPGQVPAMITNGMYNGEINYYPGYGTEPSLANFAKFGHFTQIVWKTTTKVGCFTQYCSKGLANTGNGNILPYFTVCNYSPPGKSLYRRMVPGLI